MSNNPGGRQAWTTEQDAALRGHLAAGLSHRQAASAINDTFGTTFSRDATIGRAGRIGIKSDCRKIGPAKPKSARKASSADYSQIQRVAQHPRTPRPTQEQIIMRCAEVVPLNLALVDLEAGMCRYPYGDGSEQSPYLFCGHPQRAGASYCGPHADLAVNRYAATGAERTLEHVAALKRSNRPTVFTLASDIQAGQVEEA